MNSEFFKAIDLIEAEKGIPADYMLEKVEAALLSAAKKAFGTSDNAMVVINKEKKDIKLYQVKTIVETVENEATEISLGELLEKGSKRAKLGGQIKREVKTKEFGRIAAQAAKQVIIQGIRDAERGLLYQEFDGKESEIISTVVRPCRTDRQRHPYNRQKRGAACEKRADTRRDIKRGRQNKNLRS